MHIWRASLALWAALYTPVGAAPAVNDAIDEQSLSALEERAARAAPEDQCYLYAELINRTVEYSARKYSAGETEEATNKLTRAQHFLHQFRVILGHKVKKLKRAQILLGHAAFRLKDLLHGSRYYDRPLVEETLLQVNRAQEEAMLQLFKR